MQTKTCLSCGKDYPSETNTFCPECFTNEQEAKKYEQKNCKHRYFLKNKGSFGYPKYYRECAECGKVAKITKYKIEL